MGEERENSDQSPNPEEFLDQYPELRQELEAFFKQIHYEGKTARVLGDFKILREIGSGGMGTVFEAEQISLGRKVALKVLSTHRSLSYRAVQKFHREAQAGGRQHHPGIVSIHVVGEHQGVHFIAQEFVEGGRTLADWLREVRDTDELPPYYFRETARLVAEVADALEHAHASGVIHRDIKPSNILITRDGRAKVTDFGLAQVEDALSLSRTGDYAGTPYYMSPEQALGRKGPIDSRTDVYSLGVTLYECLISRHPFDGESSHEILKKVLYHEPMDPRREDPRVPRDLAVICLKAMEKKPGNRYPFMAAMAEDLQCYLRGEGISARPTSAAVKTWRRVKRNPALYAVSSLAFAAVIALLWFYPQFMREKQSALKAQEEIIEHLETTSAINAFIQKIISKPMTGAEDPSSSLAETMLDAADEVRKEYEYKGKLGIGISIQNTLGMSMRKLGMPEKAEPYLREVLAYREANLGDDDLWTNVSRNNMAVVLSDLGRLKEAEVLYRKVVENHIKHLGPHHLNTCTVMNNLAELLEERGKLFEAESQYRELFKINVRRSGLEHEETLNVMSNLAANLLRQRKLEEAETLILKACEVQKRVLGEWHRATLLSQVHYGRLLFLQNRLEQAETALREVTDIHVKILGDEHPRTLASMICLSTVLSEKGELEEAESLCRTVWELRKQKLGAEAPVTLLALHRLAGILRKRGEAAEAEELAKQALEAQHRILGNAHPDTLLMMDGLARILVDREAFSDAALLFAEALEHAEEVLPPDHPEMAWYKIHYGQCLLELDRHEEAEVHLLGGYESLKTTFGEGDERMEEPLRLLIDLYKARKKPAEAQIYTAMLSSL
ncbi:MAG: tetratricopeptide repeat protein [Planctomycetota bacterium]|jgi:serine/threonine protein kinase